MRPNVQIEIVSPRLLAAVGREVAAGRVRDVWRPALDQVWAFLRTQPGLRTDGHNIFVYHHGDPMKADFGVEVTREFAGSGEVRPVRTPSGEAAVVRHVGPYDGLAEAHKAIHEWARESGPALAGTSWEIYGDWNEDSTKLETLVLYLLAETGVVMNQKESRTTIAQPVPELPVADVEKAQQYYRDVLGFEIGWLEPSKAIGAVSRGDVAIFFRRRSTPFEPAIHWVFAAEIDATYEELRSSGAKIVEPLEKKPWGLRQFTVEDLDGNRFYFHCD